MKYIKIKSIDFYFSYEMFDGFVFIIFVCLFLFKENDKWMFFIKLRILIIFILFGFRLGFISSLLLLILILGGGKIDGFYGIGNILNL